MIRVLHLIKGLGRGGAERLLASAAPHRDGSRFEYEVAYLLPEKTAFVSELEGLGTTVSCLDGASGWSWVRRLRRLMDDRCIHVLHAHSPVPAVGARVSVGRQPIVYTEHNLWERYHRATYWANRMTFRRNAHVFAVSEAVRRSIRPPDRVRPSIETLYHGLDLTALPVTRDADRARRELGIPGGAPVVGCIANLKAHKGHDVLLRAAVRVRDRIPDVRFVLIGQGPREPHLRSMADELGLNGTVVWAGYRDDAARLSAAFDVFTLASSMEGLSIALLEAMAGGVPAVVTDAGGLPEVVMDGREGLVVPPGDADRLADSLIFVLEDPEAGSAMGVAAKRRASLFDIRGAVRRMEEVYEGLVS